MQSDEIIEISAHFHNSDSPSPGSKLESNAQQYQHSPPITVRITNFDDVHVDDATASTISPNTSGLINTSAEIHDAEDAPAVFDIHSQTPPRSELLDNSPDKSPMATPTFETVHKKLSNFSTGVDVMKEAESSLLIVEDAMDSNGNNSNISTTSPLANAAVSLEDLVEEKISKLKVEFTVQMEKIHQENVQLNKRIQEYQHRYKPAVC